MAGWWYPAASRQERNGDKMKIKREEIGVKIIEPKIVTDNRGWFQIAFDFYGLQELGIEFHICQENHSFTESKGTIRGLNYQEAPFEQAKLVRCTAGSMYSVAADIRKGSETFGKWVGEILSAENHRIMYVPAGFAHGVITLEDRTELQYFTNSKFSLEHAKSIRYDDPAIGIDWTVGGMISPDVPNLSEKNRNGGYLTP